MTGCLEITFGKKRHIIFASAATDVFGRFNFDKSVAAGAVITLLRIFYLADLASFDPSTTFFFKLTRFVSHSTLIRRGSVGGLVIVRDLTIVLGAKVRSRFVRVLCVILGDVGRGEHIWLVKNRLWLVAALIV